jgi:hypothetical protein
VHNQHFALLETGKDFFDSTSDGILGMGFKVRGKVLLSENNYSHLPRYVSYQPQTVPENMIQHGLVSCSTFSVYFSR